MRQTPVRRRNGKRRCPSGIAANNYMKSTVQCRRAISHRVPECACTAGANWDRVIFEVYGSASEKTDAALQIRRSCALEKPSYRIPNTLYSLHKTIVPTLWSPGRSYTPRYFRRAPFCALERGSGKLLWRKEIPRFGGSAVHLARRTLFAKTANTRHLTAGNRQDDVVVLSV